MCSSLWLPHSLPAYKMATDEQKRSFLQQNVESSLAFIWTDNEVPLEVQYKLAQHYRTTRRFAALADARSDLRTAMKDDYSLDSAANAANRANVAAVISAWEASKGYVEKESSLQAESHALGITRTVPVTERQAMKRALESAHGRLQDDYEPSADYISEKSEQVEQNEITASALDEVTSKKDQASTDVTTSMDSQGRIRIVKAKVKSSLPTNTEQLRTKLRVEGNLWFMLAAKFKHKPFLQNLLRDDLHYYIDYLLGDRCNAIKLAGNDGATALHVPWSVVLGYEAALRKEAFKQAVEEGVSLFAKLKEMTKSDELRGIHFTQQLLLHSKHGQSATKDGDGTSWNDGRSKGSGKKGGKDGKGGGKVLKDGKGKGKNKGKKDLWKGKKLLLRTADGEQICFNFNRGADQCKGKCGRAHVCRWPGCGGAHPVIVCPEAAKVKDN